MAREIRDLLDTVKAFSRNLFLKHFWFSMEMWKFQSRVSMIRNETDQRNQFTI